MSEKLQNILQLVSQTVRRITAGPEQWTSYLNAAARLYKYPFQDQLLIYAQRPDATACASYDLWNRRMGRWVRRGSTGIALMSETTRGLRLKYVFDVADTNGDSHSKQPYLWSFRPEFQEPVLREIVQEYGITETDFPSALRKAAEMTVESRYRDLLPDLMKFSEGSLLEELDGQNIGLLLRRTMTASTQYILLTRCGMSPAQYGVTKDDLRGIINFNTTGTLSCLGNETADISGKILRQIEHSVKQQERQVRLENRQIQEYNDFRDLKQWPEKEELSHGTDLHEERGLSDSGSEDGRTASGRTREIWADEAEIPQRESERNVHGDDARREAMGSSSGDRPDGEQQNGATDKAVGGATRSERGIESIRSDALGSGDEQHSDAGGGNRPERTDLQLNAEPQQLSLFPTEQEQIESIAAAEDEKSSAFLIPQADITRALQGGSGFKGGKYRINDWFQHQHGTKETVDFLKHEYGTGGTSFSFSDGSNGSVWYDSKGFNVSHGWSTAHPECRLTWGNVARQLHDLVLFGKYLTPEELEKQQVAALAPKTPETNQKTGFDALPEEKTVISEKQKPESIEKSGNITNDRAGDDATVKTEKDPSSHLVTLTIDLTATQPPEKQAYIEEKEKSKAHNFRITDDHLGEGGQKTKFGYNINAIKALKAIESENRQATPEEQETLSRYVGWGGIAQAFDKDNASWQKEYAILKELLTDEEYTAARASVLNAHYTSPVVIKAIYSELESMGFRTGNILEPACGIGNFFGLLPESMGRSKLYGVELDSITGRIAKQLYPEANITVDGFEHTDSPDDFFDLAVGNVPFGEYQLADRRYDRYKFLIHDYFFGKSLDKVRPGGLIVFITSKGTLDKKNPDVRRYISQRAELLGAVRLPNTAFQKNAGTEVTTDILFLQKRDRLSPEEPEWLEIGETEDGVPVNRYFLAHPAMMLGTMAFSPRMYGNETKTTCNPIEGADFEEQLKTALSSVSMPNQDALLPAEPENSRDENSEQRESLPADPDVRNFSYTLVNGDLYFRENSMMNPVDLPAITLERVRGMIGLRDCTRELIRLQLDGADDKAVKEAQQRLNTLYDTFTKQHGLINSTGNQRAFEQDSSYCLLCSLEILDEEGNLDRKADMFTKRTIRQETVITSVNTASEALAASLSEKACVDLGYMSSLLGTPGEMGKIISDLQGVIFKDPQSGENPLAGWQTADEYLSGNVRRKLAIAREAAKTNSNFSVNVAALEKVQPKELTASEISIRLGANWINTGYIDQFMYETFDTPVSLRNKKGIQVQYSPVTGVWNITGKSWDNSNNVQVYTTYGTQRINAYRILEDCLNLKTTRVMDTKTDPDGKDQLVPNPEQTELAQEKQEAVKEAFQNWVWKDPDRREVLCKKYNLLFNSTRPREYDGGHLAFPGMNPEIRLEPHQLNAVARGLYGKNTLLAHCVGAGKTYEMIAIAMKSKQIGLCRKSIIVVPNHLTEQWGGDFLRLYPGANILVATRKDFEPRNRKKFCARIATGDYDAVILGYTQFEKIPVSKERQAMTLQIQIEDIEYGIDQAKQEKGDNFTIKQMEKSKKSLEAKLERLNDDSRKDDVVTFEELGVDRLFVDEADNYKNLFLYTKMRNVAGIGQTEAQKSSDMFMKCQYMDELTGGRGITFATGTPVSNSMTELYTMMRYLQYGTLQDADLLFFDSWAATFGETVTASELAPEGNGLRTKTRFARFFNLPELMNLWKEAADIQTADMLHLPVPDVEYVNVVTQPTEFQRDAVRELGDRAEDVRNRKVDPWVDNMLKITNDGRLLALDQRLSNPLLPDDPESKVNACVKNILKVWQESAPVKGAQLVFCDLSTPKFKQTIQMEAVNGIAQMVEGQFDDLPFSDVYNDIRLKLIQQGIPEHEIEFIHSAKTEVQKAELFAKVRQGKIRVLLGSTAKMGAGTNVQDLLIAEHHLDCPWKPRDIEQREGRIVRKGNRNKKVWIFRYLTENTFDSYNWQLIENKQKFISQIMTSKSPARSCEDIDETVLTYAEVKALATGDPRIREKMDLDVQVTKLKMLKSGYQTQHYTLEDKLLKSYPEEIQTTKVLLRNLKKDLEFSKGHPVPDAEHFSMVIKGMTYTDKKEAGTALIKACGKLHPQNKAVDIGTYCGFSVQLQIPLFSDICLILKNNASHSAEMGTDPVGNITRMNNLIKEIPQRIKTEQQNLDTLNRQICEAQEELKKPFPKEQELAEKSERLKELSLELSKDEKTPMSERSEDSVPNPLSDRIAAAQETANELNETTVSLQSEICRDS